MSSAPVRYSGISLSVQIAGVLGGGLAPMVATALLARGSGDPVYVVWYLWSLCGLALVSALAMRGDRAEMDH